MLTILNVLIMDQIFFYVVLGICLVMMLIIWINLMLNNDKQEKIISRYNQEIASLKKNYSK